DAHGPTPYSDVRSAPSDPVRRSCSSVSSWLAAPHPAKDSRASAPSQGPPPNRSRPAPPRHGLARSKPRLSRLARSVHLRTRLAVRNLARSRARLLFLYIASLLVERRTTVALSPRRFALENNSLPPYGRLCEHRSLCLLRLQRPRPLS